VNPPNKSKNRSSLPKQTGNAEAEELDSLNARARRKTNAAQLIEADIEAKAKDKRRKETAVSGSWKRSG